MSWTSGLSRRSSVPQTTNNSKEAQSDQQQQSPVETSSSDKSLRGLPGGKSRKECFVFEPQQWRKTVCKNCFRTKPEHVQSSDKEDAGMAGPNVVLRRSDNVRSAGQLPGNHAATPIPEGGNFSSITEGKSSRDNNGRSTGTTENPNAARAAARKLATGQRPEENRTSTTSYPESRRTTSGNSGSAGVYSSVSSIDARYIEELENDFFALEDKHETVIRERNELAHELETKVNSAVDLQKTLEQYSEKVNLLERRCHHMDDEIKSYRERLRLPESDQTATPCNAAQGVTETRGGSPSTASGLGEMTCSTELQQRLNEVEQLCQEVMEENEQLKEEVEEMQREIEEMHDHFQEDDRDAMRELQRDLEAVNKTCRILQFKLRKAERRYEQCEAERANLEERLARLEAELYSEADVAHIRNLEEEVRVAKEVGVRLNNELDLLDEKRAFYEEENRQLKEELQVCHNRRISAENETGRLRLEIDRVKNDKGMGDRGPLQVTDKNRARTSGSRGSQSREGGFEEQQLQKDLDISREREADLSEQLRFAEEEIRNLKRRVRESQVDNDLLTKRMDRMVAIQLPRIGSQADNAKARDQMWDLNGKKMSSSQFETELASTRRQLDLIEEENSGLKRKLHGYERGMDAANEEMQRLQYRLPRVVQADAQELDHLSNQLNLIQDHLARIEKEKDRLDSENRQLRYPTDSLSSSRTGMEASELTKENEALKLRLKDWEKKLRQLVREVNLVSSIDRDHEWMEKYNDTREALKEQELQLSRSKKRIAELQNETSKLRAQERVTEQRAQRERTKGHSSPHTSREVLLQEVKSLEEELDEVTADLTSSRELASNAQLRVTYLENQNSELQSESDRREKEMVQFILHSQHKNQVLSNLVDILHERNDSLQTEVDRLLGIPPINEPTESGGNEVSPATFPSSGSDDVFESPSEEQKQKLAVERQLRERITSLERLLSEEKQRAELADHHLENAISVRTTGPDQLGKLVESKQVDLLKKELEEKDELLEAKEEQVVDLRTRIDHSRKMNDALRALMEKEPSSNEQSGAHNVEIASYRKEIESARKEMQILRNNLSQAEKIRERLIKDNQEFQEELKLREDSIFEQDDEIEKRNAELRVLRASMETLHKELEQSKRDLATAKAREASGSSGRLSAQIAQTEKIRAELNDTTRELNDLKVQYQEVKRSNSLTEEKFSQMSADVQQMRGVLQEKDGLIIDLNKSVQRIKEEMGQSKLANQTAETERINLERQLTEVKKTLTAKEQELLLLQTKIKEKNSNLSGKERLNGPQDSVTSSTDSSGGRDGTLSRRSAEVDRLRRELSMLQSEREDYVFEIKQLRTKLEKKKIAEEQGKKDGTSANTGLSVGNSYTKALASQHPSTKISLLHEHIAHLNRGNAQLKLQNEFVQNQLIDYQRRYRSLKEQYEGEQEAWLTERVVLESKAKEQEERRLAVNNTRKLLQETSLKLSELEASSEKQHNDLKTSYEKLENEKNLLENKLKQVEEHQKLPKVLQRFGQTGSATRPGLLAAQTNTNNADTRELTRRLDMAERSMSRLRNELNELKSAKHTEQSVALNEAERARHDAEQEAEDLRDRMLTMECYRQQAELFRHRQFEIEEAAEKEYKLWQEEREHLICRAEEARVNAEQWIVQLQYRATSAEDDKTEDPIGDIIKQMEKWCASRGVVPCLKRRMFDSTYSYDPTGVGSVPASPAIGLSRNLIAGSSHLIGSHSGPTQRSTSMEWGNGRVGLLSGAPSTMNYRESSLGLGNLRGSAMSLAGVGNLGGGSNYSLLIANRCGRSVSPEVSVRKLSNYPDPTPGFLVRPTSRQDSQDSLASIDYTQRSFTLPGKPPIRSAISPARKKFFEDTSWQNQNKLSNKSTLAQYSKTMTETQKDVGTRLESSSSMATDVDTSTKDREADPARKKGSSQPPPTNGKTSKSDNTEKVKGSSTHTSLADRFARWSNMGSRSSSKTSLNENTKEGESSKKSKKNDEERSKSKSRGKSPKSSETKQKDQATSRTTSESTDKKKQQQTAKDESKAISQTTPSRPIRRSGSVTTISPAIMALRQKFAGGTKS